MKRNSPRAAIVAAFSTLILSTMMCAAATAAIRTYYIAADEVNWDYMPGGADKMGMDEDYAKFFATRGPHQIGPIYRNAIYRQYTDATFTRLKARTPAASIHTASSTTRPRKARPMTTKYSIPGSPVTVLLGAASMLTADMWPDDPGIWAFHCHFSEHMRTGMETLYQVMP